MRRHKAILVAIVLMAVSALSLLVPELAQAAQTSTSQGFKINTAVSEGALVSIDQKDSQAVEMASLSSRDAMVGVAVSNGQALVTFSDGSGRVQVVSSGQAPTQVSTANGNIKKGDRLSISPISGVAMKASSAGKVIGVAQQDFNGTESKDKKSVELTDSAGQKKTVQVGKAVVEVSVEEWAPNGQPNSPLLNNLRSFLGTTVGKPVSNVQAVMAVAVVLFAILASGIILYSSVSSSIHSIGRNPLSKGIIRRSLFVMIGLSVIVVVGAASAVYLILGG